MFESHRPLTLPQKLVRLNWPVIVLVIALSSIGTVTLYSVAGGAFDPWAQRHAVRCALGLGVLIAMALVPFRIWLSLAIPAYLAALALLIAVPVLGTEALGAKRWLAVGRYSIQPSELMKLALILMLARIYAGSPVATRSRPLTVALPLALMALPIALTLKQPDLGTAILFAGLGLGMMFLAGVSLWYFVGGAAVIGLALPYVSSHLHDYQRRRLEIFLDPTSDPLGAGYHITQAKIALGAGGLTGQGYLQGSQNQLDFVPEKMTDFIFAMIGEEWGFQGTCVVLALYATLITLLFIAAFANRQPAARLVIAGAALSLSIYVVINVAMVTGLLPVVGVPLPLISYGGTAMLTLMAALGLALSAQVHGARAD
jgi:rod shape determining protein RodA